MPLQKERKRKKLNLPKERISRAIFLFSPICLHGNGSDRIMRTSVFTEHYCRAVWQGDCRLRYGHGELGLN